MSILSYCVLDSLKFLIESLLENVTLLTFFLQLSFQYILLYHCQGLWLERLQVGNILPSRRHQAVLDVLLGVTHKHVNIRQNILELIIASLKLILSGMSALENTESIGT